ncbi:hypothetical protein GCM10027359_25150 [Marilutibacter aestuarii]
MDREGAQTGPAAVAIRLSFCHCQYFHVMSAGGRAATGKSSIATPGVPASIQARSMAGPSANPLPGLTPPCDAGS